jgi:site-specific DNA-methyltransferase (cytosine-N4-specific)
VKDRLTNRWEHVFHFVKQRKYYYNLDAIREPHKTALQYNGMENQSHFSSRNEKILCVVPQDKYQKAILENKDYRPERFPKISRTGSAISINYSRECPGHPKGKNPGNVFNWREEAKKKGQLFKNPVNNQGGGHTGLKKFRGYKIKRGNPFVRFGSEQYHGANVVYSERGKNPGDFWRISIRPFRGAHFAVYPEELCIKPIKSSCPPDGIVLDMFAGSGTTLVVAKKLGRRFLGCDINPEYVRMANERLKSIETKHG